MTDTKRSRFIFDELQIGESEYVIKFSRDDVDLKDEQPGDAFYFPLSWQEAAQLRDDLALALRQRPERPKATGTTDIETIQNVLEETRSVAVDEGWPTSQDEAEEALEAFARVVVSVNVSSTTRRPN